MTGRRGRAEQGEQNGASRTGQAEQDRQNRAGRTGQAEQDREIFKNSVLSSKVFLFCSDTFKIPDDLYKISVNPFRPTRQKTDVLLCQFLESLVMLRSASNFRQLSHCMSCTLSKKI